MESNNINALTEQSENALAELGNIGAGNAATSLSVMLGTKLSVTPPSVHVYSFDELEQVLGGPEQTVIGVLSTITGDINAMLLFVCTTEDAVNLTKVLFKTDIEWPSDMGLSAVKEIANIILSSYASSIETLTGMKVRCTQPEISIDMAAAILSVPCIEFGKVGDKALVINSEFYAGDMQINGYIMAISDIHSYDTMLSKFGIQ